MTKKFSSERLYLRELTIADASEEYSRWLNDPEVNYFLETRRATIEDVRNYIEKQNRDPNSVLLGVFDKERDKHIGNVKLEPIDWQNKQAVFGIMIGDKGYWGKGIGREATKLTLDYAFGKLELGEVELGVIAENDRARRTFEKAGFKFARLEPKAMNHNGKLFDKIVMVCKKENFV